ncbi:carbon-nitrogen hydrolase family protein [Chryseomicrobium sp. FSL W7-1435]|uniref:carbon-nitrogen hydrolase family protein n=1 Tax=Chryseomicrobium sp. FSL W7-1435 TaxID=2921704 RepID=UPI00315AB4D4
MKVAVIQLNSKQDKQKNLLKIEQFIREAASFGAELVALPENCNFLGNGNTFQAEEIPSGETTTLLSKLAKELKIFIHAGSITESFTKDKSYNTSFVIAPTGEIISIYRKIHLFDIEISGVSSYKESDAIEPGSKSEMVELPFGQAGMSICYDLRFPELYRKYALAGAKILFVPAAFTRYTGMLHWEPLLRARAIENQCYVIAAGQHGNYLPGKDCYGNSMIIDPWGTVVARASEGEGIAIAELKEDLVASARQSIPCLQHRREDLY